MNDPGRIVIGHSESERVTIDLVGQRIEDWQVAHVELASGVWKGTFKWEVHTGELHRFGKEIQELYRTLVGNATLSPMEPNLELKLTGDGLGHISVEGRAVPEFYTGTYLNFKFLIDQTELPAIIADLLGSDSE